MFTHGASGGGTAGREIRGLHPSILARKVPSQILCVPSSSRPDHVLRPRQATCQTISTDPRIFGPFPYSSATSDADELRLRPRGLAPLGGIIVTSTDGHSNWNGGWFGYDLSTPLVLDTYI